MHDSYQFMHYTKIYLLILFKHLILILKVIVRICPYSDICKGSLCLSILQEYFNLVY